MSCLNRKSQVSKRGRSGLNPKLSLTPVLLVFLRVILIFMPLTMFIVPSLVRVWVFRCSGSVCIVLCGIMIAIRTGVMVGLRSLCRVVGLCAAQPFLPTSSCLIPAQVTVSSIVSGRRKEICCVARRRLLG